MNANKGPGASSETSQVAEDWLARSLRRLGFVRIPQNASKTVALPPPEGEQSDGSSELRGMAPHATNFSQPSDVEAELETLKADNSDLLEKVRLLESKAASIDEPDTEDRELSERILGRLKEENEILSERSRMLQASMGEVQAQNTLLQDEISTLKQSESSESQGVRSLEKQLLVAQDKASSALRRSQESQEKLIETRQRLTESRNKVVDSLKLTRERLVTTSALWAEARKYFALFRQGLLADEITKSDVNLAADTYLCLLPSTVPAALDLQRKYGGRIICDCVENVEVEKHSLAPKMHLPALDMVNLGAYGSLSTVDGMMTVSHAVARTLERFGPPVRVQPNYRRFEQPTAVGGLRERFGLSPDATVLITSGNIVKGFEAVIDAIGLLPENVHLVAFAKFSPPEYDAKVKGYLAESGLDDRIHLNGFIPYDELASVLTDADMGIITLDPDNPNHAVSLPNRVFDFTTATLPFVVPQLPEIASFVERHACGVAIDHVTPAAWAAGITKIMDDLPTYRNAMVQARKSATWESLDDGLIEFLGKPSSVTLLGFRDLSRYQRFLRITDSLTSRGISVNAAFFSEDPAPIKNTEARFYHFADRYGRGPGLIEVPHEGDVADLDDTNVEG